MESTNRPPAPAADAAPEELAALAALAARLDRLAIRIARQIRAEVPGYAALPSPEHDRDVRSQISSVVAGLQARMPPPDAAIEHARAVGRRRAAAGLALPDVIEAYHIAYREIWNELLGLARPGRSRQAEQADRAEALVGLVGLLWNWFHRLSAAVAEAHVEQSRRAATTRAALHRRLVEAVVAGSAEQALPVARDLGFDVAGPFLVACADGVPETAVEALADRLAALPGVALCSTDGDRVVLVAQRGPDGSPDGDPDGGLADAVHAVAPDARVGIGLERTGPAGAALGLLDAQDALHRAAGPDRTGGTVRFADDWLLAVLGRESARLAEPLAGGAAVARAHPALAATVRAFAEQQFSITACARVLHIHPNSAKYRLDRWQTLTGWDPRSFAGLSASMVCLALTAGAEPADPVTGERD